MKQTENPKFVAIGSNFYNPYRKARGIVRAFSNPTYVLVEYPEQKEKGIGHDAAVVQKWMNVKKYDQELKKIQASL
jgi:hypothetical protein